MSLTFVGTHFAVGEPWAKQEHHILRTVKEQIQAQFSAQKNLLVNLTWFGPQFDNSKWEELQQLVSNEEEFDQLFWLAPVDPVSISAEIRQQIQNDLHVQRVYCVGASFNPGKYTFNTGAIASYEDFPKYNDDELALTNVKNYYLCYNRKPKPHRIRIVESLYENNLEEYGIVTLGLDNVNYNVTEDTSTDLYLKLANDDPANYVLESTSDKNYNEFGGVPFDVCSLGKLDVWQTCFLNVVSETEWRPWDDMFVTEKTWKPIVGMRPFLINGQPQIYKWLRDNGFKTFNHYFKNIELEDVNEEMIIISITSAIQQLTKLSKDDVQALYQEMLPDLIHNRTHFFEFAKKQQYKMEHLF
jgi:hypothetical protein